MTTINLVFLSLKSKMTFYCIGHMIEFELKSWGFFSEFPEMVKWFQTLHATVLHFSMGLFSIL